ncbi:hypothetical protein N0V94_007449 [Neodidymelliopsis sp. IMI 364377]|nr:hypothetical protein N0V94_007449 [Neodidymelliopsis sp. IMI 364377]
MSSPLPYNRQNALASAIAADNASNITGKVVLTTGVTQGGLGATFVETIAHHKPSLLILAGRSTAKTLATASQIYKISNVETRILPLDLASQSNIRAAAQTVLNWPDVPHIDVLVNSAGVMAGPYSTTEDGIEWQFGANHIGHFLLANLLMPKLLAAPAARIVSVASDGHRFSGVRFSDLTMVLT